MKTLVLALLVTVTGCNVGVDYRRPGVAVPDRFGELPTTLPAGGSSRELATDRHDAHR